MLVYVDGSAVAWLYFVPVVKGILVILLESNSCLEIGLMVILALF